MVGLVSWFNIDSGSLQVLINDGTQYRSRVRNNHECLACEIPRTDGLERSETVVARQDHHEGLLHQEAERQSWHPLFPPKKSCIDFSLRQAVREARRVLTRYHHVDVRQLIAQDPQSFRHPGPFVSGEKT